MSRDYRPDLERCRRAALTAFLAGDEALARYYRERVRMLSEYVREGAR